MSDFGTHHPDAGAVGGAGGGVLAGGLTAWASDSYKDSRNRWNESAIRGVAWARTY